MFTLTATELANQLGLSRGRISQMVSAGQLDGCFDGDGRSRRFDLTKAQSQLRGTLDPGQLLGNGAKTKSRLDQSKPQDAPIPKVPLPIEASEYEQARTRIAVEQARKLERQSAVDEGRYLLVSEVAHQVDTQIRQEVAEFESALRDAARKVADEYDLDFKTVRKLLIDQWRTHRRKRAKVLEAKSVTDDLTEEELKEDI